MDKYEFGSAEWVAELRRVVEEGCTGRDLTGIEYSFTEEYTDPPPHLCRDGAATIGWYLRISGDRVEVGDTPLRAATVKVVADYQTVLPLARLIVSDAEGAATMEKLAAEAMDAGKLRTEGDRSVAPPFLEELNLHDRIVAKTA